MPLWINLTDAGMPDEMPAVNPWDPPLDKYPEFRHAFATSIVCDASGRTFYGNSGRSYPPEYEPGGRYRAEAYRAFLQRGLERFREVERVSNDPSLSASQRAARRAALLLSYRKDLQPLSRMGPAAGPGVAKPSPRR